MSADDRIKDKPLSRHPNLEHFKYEVAQEMGLSNRRINKDKSIDKVKDTAK